MLFMSGAMLAQQRKQAAPVQRTFVPNEPLPCVAFNQMADRLDAVYKTEEISKTEYDKGMKKVQRWHTGRGRGLFHGGKDKYQKSFSTVEQAR